MKITEYPTAQFFDENDVLIKDGANGTKQIKASDMVYALFDPIPEMHGQIFRGKSLGSTFTTAQQQAVSDGSFHDLWIGDYWESGEIKYRIADFDYYAKGAKDANDAILPHHVVVVPDTPIIKTTVQYGTSNLAPRYDTSSIRSSSVMSSTRSAINSFFGEEHIMDFYDYYAYALTTDRSGKTIVDNRYATSMNIELMEASMILGPNTLDHQSASNYGIRRQFNLFRISSLYMGALDSHEVGTTSYYPYWTRTIAYFEAKTNEFNKIVSIGAGGCSTNDPTATALYIRPFFCLN